MNDSSNAGTEGRRGSGRATLLRGRPVAAGIRERIRADVTSLQRAGTTPTLAAIAMTDDPASKRYLELKGEAATEVGIDVRETVLPADAPAERCYEVVEAASESPAIDAVFVQVPLPASVDTSRVRDLIDPTKDADCFRPENLGRFVAGDPGPERPVGPATVRAVLALLNAYDVSLAGRDVTIVGRSAVIGRPLANHLLGTTPGPAATVTTCHTHTRELATKTRRADVLITACGEPGLIDGAMLSAGVVVVDVSATRVESDGTVEVEGDVAYESASEKASAITPVPGGVGPVTIAALLENVVTLADRRT